MVVTKFVLINKADNVLICCQSVQAGEITIIGTDCYKMMVNIDVGHKIARSNLSKGQKVIKYGVSIGSVTADIRSGEHVHIHNLKSDYIPSHFRHSITGD